MKRFLFVVVLYYLSTSRLYAQNFLWGQYGIGDALTQDISVDNRGNCYLSGLIPNDTVHFGSYTLMNSTVTNPPYSINFDAFLVKYDVKGNIAWAKQWYSLDTSDMDEVWSPATVATDNKENVYLNANFPDTLLVGTYTLINNKGYQSTCIAKYDSNGNLKWIKASRNGGNSNSTGAIGNHITCDKWGNVFLLGGGSYDTVYFGTSMVYFYQNANSNDFLVKYDSAGNVKWAKQAIPHNGNSGCVSYCVTTDVFGNAYTTGSFSDTVKYGTNNLIDAGNIDFQIVKWDSSGNVLWARQGIPANMQPAGASGISVTVDKYGSVYACGQFFGSFLIGPDTIQQIPGYLNNFFVVKYSPNGNVIWVKQATVLDGTSWLAWSIASDTNNNIYLSGDGGGADTCKIAFGGDTLKMVQTNNELDCFLFKLDTSGKASCGVIMQKGNPEWTFVTSDASGRHVYFASSFSTLAVFGQDTVKPKSYPTNHIQGYNYFPTIARWQACDSNIFQAVPEEQKPLSNVLVYPNPNNGNFIIALQNINEPAQVEIYNMLGEKVQSKKMNTGASQIKMSSQASGVYFYRVIQENGSLIGSGKVVVER